jgi:hypothetical protein
VWKKGIGVSVDLPSKLVLIGFNIKVLASILFVVVFTYYYGAGVLSMDTGDYMYESKMLFNVLKTSPSDYFKLLTGVGENDELIIKYLKHTKHWKTQNIGFYNDAKSVIRLNSLFLFVTNGFTYTHALIASFLSLIGIIQLVHVFKRFSELKPVYLFFAFILFPSLTFWTAGVLKEPFVVFGLGLFLNALFTEGKSKLRITKFIVGLAFLVFFKGYILICLLLAILFYLLLKRFTRIKPVFLFFGTLVLIFSSLFIFKSTTNWLVFKLSERQIDFDNVGRGGLYCYDSTDFYRIDPKDSIYFSIHPNEIAHYDSVVVLEKDVLGEIHLEGRYKRYKPGTIKAGTYLMYDYRQVSKSYVPVEKIDYSFENFLKFIPKTILLAAIRPFPHEPGGIFKYLAFVEVLVLSVWFIYVFFHRKTLMHEDRAMIWSLFVFALLLLIVVGLTISISGALVRYRIPAYMAFILISFILYSPKKKNSK